MSKSIARAGQVSALMAVMAVAALAAPRQAAATAPLWQPPEATPKHPPHKRRAPPAARDVPAAGSNSTEALEKEVFGPESAPAVSRSARQRRQGDDGDDDDGGDASDAETYGGARARATGNLPAVIAPHLIAFGLGTAVMTRSFRFNAPLQPDDGSARAGVVAELESFPLISIRNRWLARLGLGASFGTEVGSAGIGQADGGTLSYGVSENRWSFDLRYALPLGQRFLLVPLAGYGHAGYDLQRRMQPAPSTCAATSTQTCLSDVQLSHVTLGFDARFAFTPSLAASLAAAYLPSFGLGRGAGQLGVESDASAQGMSGTLAVSWQLLDWLALRAALPVVHTSYAFSRRPLAYTSASETYYGLIAGATVFTH